MINMKMEDFHCKARLVAWGHMEILFSTVTYTRLVSGKTVQILLIISAHVVLKVLAADMVNVNYAPN